MSCQLRALLVVSVKYARPSSSGLLWSGLGSLLAVKHPITLEKSPSKVFPEIYHLDMLFLWIKKYIWEILVYALHTIKINCIIHLTIKLRLEIINPTAQWELLLCIGYWYTVFLAVQDSSIGDLVTQSVSESVTFWFTITTIALQ